MFAPNFYKLGSKVSDLLTQVRIDHMSLVSTDHVTVHAARDGVVGFGFGPNGDEVYHSFAVDQMPGSGYALEAVVVDDGSTLVYLREVGLPVHDVIDRARRLVLLDEPDPPAVTTR